MLTALLTGCGAGVSEAPNLALPPLKEYPAAAQKRAADEITAHGKSVPTLVEMVGDYGDLRAAIRAANPKP